MPVLRELNYNGIDTWVRRFLKRYNYILSIPNKVGDIIKENASELASNFFLYYHQFLKDNDINEESSFIANMDETPVWYEILYKTVIEKIGNNHVAVKSFNCDKVRINLLLTILSNGNKLAPLVVFRGKSDGPFEKELQKNLYVKNNSILVKYQESSWVNSNIFKFWLINIWFKYKNAQNHRCLLILNRATSHYIDNLDSIMKKNNSAYILIPPGLTKLFQPLDISINFPFKHYLKEQYCSFNIVNMNKKKVTHNEIINMIYHTCMIKKKFR